MDMESIRRARRLVRRSCRRNGGNASTMWRVSRVPLWRKSRCHAMTAVGRWLANLAGTPRSGLARHWMAAELTRRLSLPIVASRRPVVTSVGTTCWRRAPAGSRRRTGRSGLVVPVRGHRAASRGLRRRVGCQVWLHMFPANLATCRCSNCPPAPWL